MTDGLVRRATPDDIADLLRLNAFVQGWHAETYPDHFHADPAPDQQTAFFSGILDTPDAYVWVSHAGKVGAGYLFATHQRRPDTPTSRAVSRLHCEHIVTDPAFRRQGHASALFAAFRDAARDLRVDSITLDSWAANFQAHEFFAKMGMNVTRHWFEAPAR